MSNTSNTVGPFKKGQFTQEYISEYYSACGDYDKAIQRREEARQAFANAEAELARCEFAVNKAAIRKSEIESHIDSVSDWLHR